MAGSMIYGIGGAPTAPNNPTVINGALLFSADRLQAAITAINASSAPYAAAYSALNSQAVSYEGHASSRTTIASTNSPALPASTFGCPAAGSSQSSIASTIQGLFNTDMAVAYMEALNGYLSNQNAPTALSLVRDWTENCTSIASYDIPSNYGGSDGPLMMNSVGSGIIIAACLFDEAANGNWSNLSGWTSTDRTNVENYIINVWYSSSLIVLGECAAGNAPNNNMMNNWQSHALQTQALSGFYLLGSSNPTNVALGQSYINNAAARIAQVMTGSITNTNDGAYTYPFIPLTSGTVTGLSMKYDPGDLMAEDERGIDALAYTMFSARSLVGAMQAVRAGNGTNFFHDYSSSLNLMLNTLLFHTQYSPTYMDCYAGTQNTLPYNGAEVYEAMGAYFSSSAYTSYAASNRPAGGDTTMLGASGQGAIGPHSYATITALLNTSESTWYPAVQGATSGFAKLWCPTGSAMWITVPVSMSSGGGGGGGGYTGSNAHPNEPSGFIPVVDTGYITGSPANSQTGGSWSTFHNGILNTWTNYGPSGSSYAVGGAGLNPQYIMLASGSPPGSGLTNSGWMQRFDTTLAGGNAPVNVQCPVTASGSGCVYLSYWVKAFAQNGEWSNERADGTYLGVAAPKHWYIRNGGPGGGASGQENHAIIGQAPGNATNQPITAYAQVLKQINAGSQAPTGGSFEDYIRLDVAPYANIEVQEPRASFGYNSQSYVQVEWILQEETTANTSADARIQYYISGVLAYDSANNSQPGTDYPAQGTFNLMAANSVRGWWQLVMNTIWGGANADQGPACPNGPQYFCFDYVYMSVSPGYLTGAAYTAAAVNWTGSNY